MNQTLSTEEATETPEAEADCSAPDCSPFEWWVYSTAITPGWLMLRCEKTDKTGTVRDPSREEWRAAFYAPSNPYQWHDSSRVVVDD